MMTAPWPDFCSAVRTSSSARDAASVFTNSCVRASCAVAFAVALRLQQVALCLLHRRLEGVRLDAIEDVAFLDVRTVLEQDVLEIAGHAGADLNPIDCLDPTDELARLGDRSQCGGHSPHRDGGRLLRLARRRRDEQARDGAAQTNDRMVFPIPAFAASSGSRPALSPKQYLTR